jgi:hypothetical protein
MRDKRSPVHTIFSSVKLVDNSQKWFFSVKDRVKQRNPVSGVVGGAASATFSANNGMIAVM